LIINSKPTPEETKAQRGTCTEHSRSTRQPHLQAGNTAEPASLGTGQADYPAVNSCTAGGAQHTYKSLVLGITIT